MKQIFQFINSGLKKNQIVLSEEERKNLHLDL